MGVNFSVIHNRKGKALKPAIELRVYFPALKTQIYVSTGIRIEPRYFRDGQIHPSHPRAIVLNQELNQCMSKLRDLELRCAANQCQPTPNMIRALFRVSTPGSSFVAFAFDQQNTQQLAPGTIKHERRAFNVFESLFPGIRPTAITLATIQEFNNHLHGQHLATDTIYNYHKIIRKYLFRAIDNDLIASNPYRKFKAKRTAETPRGFLSAAELDRLKTMPLTSPLHEVRQRFVFMCYTGLAFTDCGTLSPAHIVEKLKHRWIVIRRQKTGRHAHIPILPDAEAVLNQKHATGLYFEPISNQAFNRMLKALAAAAGIDRPLTSHMARHTFATTVALANGISYESLSKLLGSTLKTATWYGKVIDARLIDEMKHLF